MPSKRKPRPSAVAVGQAFRREPDDTAPEPPHVSDMLPDGARADHAVYFITSRDLEPLYIGSTSQLLRRLREHARDRDWFTPDCRIFVEWFTSRDDAYLREAHAIHSAHPKHNRRFDLPTGECPTPAVPLRPLTDLERDMAASCRNCGERHVRADDLCTACYRFRERHGVDRPADLFDAYLTA